MKNCNMWVVRGVAILCPHAPSCLLLLPKDYTRGFVDHTQK